MNDEATRWDGNWDREWLNQWQDFGEFDVSGEALANNFISLGFYGQLTDLIFISYLTLNVGLEFEQMQFAMAPKFQQKQHIWIAIYIPRRDQMQVSIF